MEMKLDINLRVADLAVSRRWYADVFAAEPIYSGVDRTLEGVGTPMICFRLGGVKVWLLPRKAADPRPDGNQAVGLAFMVREPLAPLRRKLAAKGVAFDDRPTPGFPIDAEGIRIGKDAEFMYVLDPDGHRLEFCFPYALAPKGSTSSP